MRSNKQRKFLGANGFLVSSPSEREEESIKKKYTNGHGEFEHKNPRIHKREHIVLSKIHKFNDRKFALVGISPTDKKSVSKIISHG